MNSLSLNLSNQAAAGDQFWITLEQEKPDDLATVAEAAEVIDKLFELDPCVPVEEEEADAPEQSLEEILAAAQEALDNVLLDQHETLCPDENGCFPATVRVYRSHQARPYTLLVQGGEKVSTIVGNVKAVAKTVAVKDASSVSIDLPADQEVAVSWQGPCYSSASGRLEQSPEIVVQGGKISWGIAVSAVLSVRYSMPYDLVTIQTTEEDCSVTGLYHLSVDEIDLEPPPADDEAMELCSGGGSHFEDPDDEPGTGCYREINHKVLCVCTNQDSGDSYTERLDAACGDSPAGSVVVVDEAVSYKGCGDRDKVNDPEFFKTTCCRNAAPNFLPDCEKRYGVYSGMASPDTGQIASLRATYGDRLNVVMVGPEKGPCGTHVYAQKVRPLNCCEDAPKLSWDSENSAETLAPGGSAVVYIMGGTGSNGEGSKCEMAGARDWQVSGADVWFDAAHTQRKITTTQNCVRIYAGSEACGMTFVYVTDGCTSTSGGLRATEGRWVLIGAAAETDPALFTCYDGSNISKCCPDTGECYNTGIPCTMDQACTVIDGEFMAVQYGGVGTYRCVPVDTPPYYFVDPLSGLSLLGTMPCHEISETAVKAQTIGWYIYQWEC